MNATSTSITVSELTFAIKNQLESRFNALVVQGEVSNAKLHSSGHFYFDLKDAGAKISAVMFRPQCQSLSRQPKEGDHVVIKGGLSVYPPHGKYQLVARTLEYLGVGELLLKLEALKKKLQMLGWFDPEKKKPLPPFPRCIGVVTSPTGAVIRDIIQVLTRRFSGFHLILNPVRVQGTEAPFEIARAIEQFNQHKLADVLIVGRGGGSLEDLWAFNEEIVPKAIFESTIPIISAVGHETDVTIADFVADVRAPTPSAAAEMVSAEKAHYIDSLKKAKKSLFFTLSHRFRQMRTQLRSYERHPLLATSYGLLSQSMQKLDDVKYKLDQKIREDILRRKYCLTGRHKQAMALRPGAQINTCKARLKQLQLRLDGSAMHYFKLKAFNLNKTVQGLHSLDPKKVLKRGYTILFAEKKGSVIVSTQNLIPGQTLNALLSDGEAQLTVNTIKSQK